MEGERVAVLTPYGEFPPVCPKCGQPGYPTARDLWDIEFHASHNGVPWSCYDRDRERIARDHLHCECKACRYRFPMAPKDDSR